MPALHELQTTTHPGTNLAHPVLGHGEIANVEAGPWFGSLSLELRQAILARARVRHAPRGTLLVRRGAPATDWIGVASGALRLGSSAADGRAYTLELLSPGQWYGDIALLDGRPVDLELQAHAASTLMLVPKADLLGLVRGSDELRQALAQLNCRRLRHVARRFEEQQTLPLWQRVALALHRLTRQFGRAHEHGVLIDVAIAQGDLADLLCASRQRVNGVLRQMQSLGIVSGGHARIVVLSAVRLAELASARRRLEAVATYSSTTLGK
jgi:CRP-like cAMP-binding protein